MESRLRWPLDYSDAHIARGRRDRTQADECRRVQRVEQDGYAARSREAPAQQIKPVLMTGLDFAPPQSSPLRIAFHEESRLLGITNGFVIPIRHEGDRRSGGFSCGTRFARRELERWWARIGSTVEVALHYADAHHLRLTRQAAARMIRLTDRERECLLWLSRGLRNDRIAERMGITNPTVELHLANARRKLSASTREQALAKAVALSLIAP